MASSPDIARLYDDHAPALFAFLLNLLRNEADTFDVMQDLFVKLGRHPSLLDGVRDERGFLLRLAHNAAVDLIRRHATREKNYDQFAREPLQVFQNGADPDEQIFREKLAGALAELPPEQRAVLHLKLWENLTFEAIAETLEIPLKTDLLASMALAYQGDRDICVNLKFDQGVLSPQGWNRLEQVNLNRAYQEFVLPRIDPAAHLVSSSLNHSLDQEFQKAHSDSGLSAFLHHDIMARMTTPALFHTGEKTAAAQCDVDMAQVACALERYRLAQGDYPDQLDALVPRFIPSLPHDVVNGQPLQYLHQHVPSSQFILCSVGWKSNGEPTESKTPSLRGDWIWKYPAAD